MDETLLPQEILNLIKSGKSVPDNDSKLTKVWAEVTGFWADVCSGESMWAEDLGNNLYRLRNNPFYLYGYSFGDIVEAIEPDPESKPVIQKVYCLGGHSNLRIIVLEAEPRNRFNELIAQLKDHKAGYENCKSKLYAVDVEPEGDYQKVMELLKQGLAEKVWEYEEANIEHDLR